MLHSHPCTYTVLYKHPYSSRRVHAFNMCGYQCDKAVTKNDIISLHRFELSNQIDCNNLVGPIGLPLYFS